MFLSSQLKLTILTVWQCIDFLTFGFTLALALHNIVKYLIFQNRWNNLYLCMFYALTTLVSATRLYYFYCEYRAHNEEVEEDAYAWQRRTACISMLAFLLKSFLGTFQVGGMIEVCIRVKESKQLMSERKAKNLTILNRTLMYIGILLFLVAGGFNLFYVYHGANTEFRYRYYLTYNPTVLITLSVALCVASIVLVYNVRRHFPVGLKEEARRVQIINVVFTVTYMTRALTFMVTHFFVKKFKDEFTIYLIYYVGYNIWDVFPLTLIMYYHHVHFAVRESRETIMLGLCESVLSRAASEVESTVYRNSIPGNYSALPAPAPEETSTLGKSQRRVVSSTIQDPTERESESESEVGNRLDRRSATGEPCNGDPLLQE